MIYKAIETVFTLISILGVGAIISHLGWYREEHKSFLSDLILKVSVPCIVVENLLVTFTREELFSSSKLLLVTFLGIMITFLIAYILTKLLGLKGDRKSGFLALSSIGNIMFIGLPVASTLFGQESIPYVMIIYLVSNILLWVVFAPMFRERKEGLSFGDKLRERLGNLVSIPLITMGISIVFLLLGVKLPEIITKPIGMVGSMGTPLALIFIGGLMHEVGFENIRLERDIVYVILMRFIVAPVIMFLLGKAFALENLQIEVFTLLSGMSGMTQLGVISATYSEDSEFVMTSIVITTLLVLVFVPVSMMILPKFL